MIDEDVDGRVRIPSRVRVVVVQDEVGERVGGVRVLGFVFAALAGPEDPLHIGIEFRFDLRADLGGEAEPAGKHAVSVGPHPQLTRPMMTFPAGDGVFDPGPRRDTRVPQRHQAEFGRGEQFGFRVGIFGGGLGDHLRLRWR